jgi:hypothetical protein
MWNKLLRKVCILLVFLTYEHLELYRNWSSELSLHMLRWSWINTSQSFKLNKKSVLRLSQLQANLTFICPCIVNISLKYNQQEATLSWSIYFYKFFYMFQAVPPPIIRSTKLYIQRQVLSNQYCCLLLLLMRWKYVPAAADSSIGLTIPDAVCTVLCSWWWAEEAPESCRTIYRNK